MFKIMMVAPPSSTVEKLGTELTALGFTWQSCPDGDELEKRLTAFGPDLALVTRDSPGIVPKLVSLAKQPGWVVPLTILEMVTEADLAELNFDHGSDDFVVAPWKASEIAARARRIIERNEHQNAKDRIKRGGLIINLKRCEVSVDGQVVELTFKEYELLKFLALNEGRVFPRETLLNKIWGYDYYGGDRTVDVHIRRLRSKIEKFGHTFVETVRNIGYRFKED